MVFKKSVHVNLNVMGLRLLRDHQSPHTVKGMCLLISQPLMHKEATLLFKSNLCGFYLLSHMHFHTSVELIFLCD